VRSAKGLTCTVVAKEGSNASVYCKAEVLHSHLLPVDLQAGGGIFTCMLDPDEPTGSASANRLAALYNSNDCNRWVLKACMCIFPAS
jgi:hypothetical protein